MSEFRRRLMMQSKSNLNTIPVGCVRCKYLESYVDVDNSNGQYIDTEKKLSKEEIFGYKVSFLIPPTTGIEKGVNGWQYHYQGTYTGCHIRVFADYFDIMCGSSYCSKTNFDSVDDTFDIEFNPMTKKVSVNKSILSYTFYEYDPYTDNGYVPYTFYLFAANNVGSPWSGANMRVYNYWVKDKDGNYTQYFVPILDENGKPCMYDTVNKKYHYNKRTNRTEDFRYEIL